MILQKQSVDRYSEWLSVCREGNGGVILIDKEKDWTSFDVVAKLRSLTGIRKIGHAGTLDPLADGLLILCLGKATKTIHQFQDEAKEYQAIVKLGATTKTDDAEGEEEDLRDIGGLDDEIIRQTVASFVGRITQVPPMYSAVKHKGVRLYKLARKGRSVQREPRSVEIHAIDLLKIDRPLLHLSVRCSKGTYIRTLARDIGAGLSCGGYLYGLRRTAIGTHSVDSALTLKDIARLSGDKVYAGLESS